jgi:allantoate deiminase
MKSQADTENSSPTMKCSPDRIKRDLLKLGNIGRTSSGGVSRFAFTPEDFEARRFVMELMRGADLIVKVDKVGNIIGSRAGIGNDLPCVTTGSHIDTVPNAGIFDGCVGVIGAIELIRVLNEKGIKTVHPIEVIVFNNEEGVRYEPLSGSTAISGQRPMGEILESVDEDGIKFRNAFERGGYDLNKLPEPGFKKGVKSFIELHIEQGPVLEAGDYDVGIVDSINGIIQMIVTFKGKAGHAGSTPMSMRRDALLSAAKTIVEVNDLANQFGKGGVGTVGLIRAFPGAINVISERVEIGIDIRDSNREMLEKRAAVLKEKIYLICKETNVDCEIFERLNKEPGHMSPKIIKVLEDSAKELGLKLTHLNSGAYHDTLEMTKVTDCGMLFVPSRDGISHAPLEFTDWKQIAAGADVLMRSLLKLAKTRQIEERNNS